LLLLLLLLLPYRNNFPTVQSPAKPPSSTQARPTHDFFNSTLSRLLILNSDTPHTYLPLRAVPEGVPREPSLLAMPLYALRVSLSHLSFRIPELLSISQLFGFEIKFVSSDKCWRRMSMWSVYSIGG
jgi:hypothetical protein